MRINLQEAGVVNDAIAEQTTGDQEAAGGPLIDGNYSEEELLAAELVHPFIIGPTCRQGFQSMMA